MITRVVFVGLHNKPNMKPLDSKTKSGKLIDRIGERCRRHGMNVLKTNLYDVNYLPEGKEKGELAFDWIERVELFEYDIVVLLGAMVHHDFPNLTLPRLLKVAHPASKRSHVDMDEYVESTFKKILHSASLVGVHKQRAK